MRMVVIILICGTTSLLRLGGLLRISHARSDMFMESLSKLVYGGFASLNIFWFEVPLHEPNVILDEVTFCVVGCKDVSLHAVRSAVILML